MSSPRIRSLLVTMSVLGTVVAVPAASPRPAPASAALASQSLNAVADTFVNEAAPTTPGGDAPRLVVDGSPRRQAFLRFDVPAFTEPLSSATLRLHVADVPGAGSPVGGTVAGSSDVTWPEATTTWESRPPIDRPSVGAIGSAQRNRWVERQVTPLIQSGTSVTLAITSANPDNVIYDARGSGFGPRLILDFGAPPPPPGAVMVAAVGDMVCGPGGQVTATACRQQAVSNLVVRDPSIVAFLALGDLQYNNGELANFQSEYEPSFGRANDITRPVPGNHEYRTPGAAGYYSYFGAAAGDPSRGYYSFDLGSSWHLVALNSNCGDVSCGNGSAQVQWLRADLAANTRPCVLAYWHHPRITSGLQAGNNPTVVPFLQALQQHRAEVVLTGHAHVYERFAPQRPDGTPAADGIRQFVVGTGGRDVGPSYRFHPPPERNSQRRIAHVFGIVKLRLAVNSYRWSFVNQAGRVLDSGTESCH